MSLVKVSLVPQRNQVGQVRRLRGRALSAFYLSCSSPDLSLPLSPPTYVVRLFSAAVSVFLSFCVSLLVMVARSGTCLRLCLRPLSLYTFKLFACRFGLAIFLLVDLPFW